jgi:hypothetical protein
MAGHMVATLVSSSSCWLRSAATATAQIVKVALQADPCNRGKTALFVGGTLGNDDIRFNPGSNSGAVKVRLKGVSLGSFTFGSFTFDGGIVAYGQAGDDDIQVAGSITKPAWLYGQSGGDRELTGSVNPGNHRGTR